MKLSPWIKVNGRTYSHDELNKPLLENDLSALEKSALKFCQAWLTGQQEFHLQTSGSTGTPKEIVLQRTQMEASARQTITALELKASETALVGLDTRYIAGQMMLVRGLIAQMNILIVPATANPFEKIENETIDFVALVPYQLENVIDQNPSSLNHVRCAIIGGAAISNSLREKAKEITCALYATYGMTETISHIALQRLNGNQPQHYFEAFQPIKLRLDHRGCLCIKANYLAEEIITNDLVELEQGNKFNWLGRIDNIINSGGVKIIPEKVELVFEKIFDNYKIKNRFFITGLPHEKLGNQVTMIIEGISFNEEIQKKILEEAHQILGKYELPKKVVAIKAFEETATGKINRLATVSCIS